MKQHLLGSFRVAAFLAAAVIQSNVTRADDAPPVQPAGAAPARIEGGKIQFDSTSFDFDKAIGGSAVRHDFYFTNTGNATLRIVSVNTSCGCTTAGEWTREVAPGGSGKIPLQFNSGNFSGPVTKTATVMSTDAATPSVTLMIKGNVWRPLEVNPPVAMLNVNSELVSNATATVHIINHTPEPLEVFEPTAGNAQFAVELRTNTPGKAFDVIVRTVPPLNIVNPHGVISVRTSSSNNALVTFNAMCVVQPSIAVVPQRIMVSETLLTNDWTTKAVIKSGLNSLLKLSNPAVNVPGARAELREIEPGKQFEVTVVLPKQTLDAKNPELVLTSNFNGYETVHVPIIVSGPNTPIGQGVPLTGRASRYLNSPEGRRALTETEPTPEEIEGAGDADETPAKPEQTPAPK